MPYIKQEDRDKIVELGSASTPGELNYMITTTVLNYLDNHDKHNYTGYNEAVGVLECVKLELYRRLISDFEDLKATINGDIPGYQKGHDHEEGPKAR